MRIGAFRVPKRGGIRVRLPNRTKNTSRDGTERELPYYERFCLPRPRVTKRISNQNVSVICELRLFTATKI